MDFYLILYLIALCSVLWSMVCVVDWILDILGILSFGLNENKSDSNVFQVNYSETGWPDKIHIGEKYNLSFLMLEGQRHRGFEVIEVVGFEEAYGDPEYYPIVKEKNGKTYATCKMRLRNLTTDTPLALGIWN